MSERLKNKLGEYSYKILIAGKIPAVRRSLEKFLKSEEEYFSVKKYLAAEEFVSLADRVAFIFYIEAKEKGIDSIKDKTIERVLIKYY